MRGQLIVAVATSMLAAVALAQGNTTSVPATSSTSAPGATTSSTAAAPSTATSTTTVSTAAAPSAERKLKFDFVNYNYVAATDFKNREGNVASQNVIGAKYSLGSGRSVGFRQGFDYQFPKQGIEGEGTEGIATMQDTYLSYTNAKLAEFLNQGSVYLQARLYLPTGELSRNSGTQGSLLAWFIATYPFGKVDINSHFIGRYYNQSTNWTVADDKPVANRDYDVTIYPIEATYNATDNLAISANTQVFTRMFRSTPGVGIKRQQLFTIETYADYKVNKQITLSLGATDDINIWDPKHDLSLYRDDEITYYLQLAASI